MSKPSRFDLTKRQLLSAGGGRLFDEAIQPDFNRHQCDIRLKEDMEPILEGTKCILLLGEPAAKLWLNMPNGENNLNEIRGSVFYYDGRFSGQDIRIPTIATYFPQDAADPRDFESQFNSQSDDVTLEDDFDEEYDGDEKGRKNQTKRKNFNFWMRQDIQKCKRLIKNNGIVPPPDIYPNYIIHIPENEIINLLEKNRGRKMFIDIETFVPSCDIKCIGFSFDREREIYIFPVFSYDYSWAFTNLHRIFRALAKAIKHNTVIAHNGASFDFLIFAWKYKIPIVKVEDTMIMQHRFYSSVEKSLGHCISLYTWEPFHKDEGGVGYYTPEQQKQTMEYCGKDVYGMKLVYYEMLKRAAKIPGLIDSMNRANAMIRPYLTITIQGFAFDEEMRKKMIHENDRLCMHYIRMCKILVGEVMYKTIAGKSKSSMLNSNKQLCTYFHDILGYDVMGRGKEKEDGTRGPSLAKKAMFKLKMKYDNPVIDLALAYRELIRETGYLNFTPWSPDFLQKLKHEQLALL